MRKFISSIAPKTVTDTFTTNINSALTPLNSFKVNLTEDEKDERSIAEGREGYARLISRIANQYPNALSRSDVPTDLVNLLNYFDNLGGNKIAVLQAMEVIAELQLATSIDAMNYVDRYVQSLQISRGNDASLDLAMREVDEYNSRFGSRPNATPPTS